MKRRQFIALTALGLIGVSFLKACGTKALQFITKITGTNHILGHRLWTKDFPKPTVQEQQNIVIIGGGISALSAARALTKSGETDFVVYELEAKLGGNARGSQNEHSRYPTGAHYVPALNLHHHELVHFFEEEQIITGYKNQKPIYNPEYVCHSPAERLFMDYQWIEGIEPSLTNDERYHQQMHAFSERMESLRYEKGTDGRFAFDLPIAYSSVEEQYRKLDKISMYEWLIDEAFDHPNLLWYVDYCCLDDFGRNTKHVSAWAGIHYFTSRKYKIYAHNQEILTWPEGNEFLVDRLKKYTEGKTNTAHIAYNVQETENGVLVHVFDQKTNTSKTILANKVILATPEYINRHLLDRTHIDFTSFKYTPWFVATIVLDRFPVSEGAHLCWENIIFKGKGLGYVFNQHQNLSQFQNPFVITYYRALDSENLTESRRNLFHKSAKYWEKEVIEDLKNAHPKIEQHIQSIEIFKRGHGMICPSVDFIFSENLEKSRRSIHKKIYFAHTDFSGISLFEEAFYQGTNAVKHMLNND